MILSILTSFLSWFKTKFLFKTNVQNKKQQQLQLQQPFLGRKNSLLPYMVIAQV